MGRSFYIALDALGIGGEALHVSQSALPGANVLDVTCLGGVQIRMFGHVLSSHS
jgi:hypothetical protein